MKNSNLKHSVIWAEGLAKWALARGTKFDEAIQLDFKNPNQNIII
jgi:hypothetical protein